MKTGAIRSASPSNGLNVVDAIASGSRIRRRRMTGYGSPAIRVMSSARRSNEIEQ